MKTAKILLITLIAIVLYACSGDENDRFKPIAAEDVEFFEDGEVEMLFDNAGANGITMVFIGDGYTKEDLGKIYGSYKPDAERYFEALFSTEPFASYQEHFNAAIIYTESQSRTIPEGIESADSTALETYTYTGFAERSFYNANPERINFYKNKLPVGYQNKSNTLIVLNNRGRGNACVRCNIGFSGSQSETTMIHEIGHSFGGLGDEYELQNTDGVPDLLFTPNLDSTEDLTQIKWKHFIDQPGYENVGAYEGGGFYDTGIWRPQRESVMRGGGSTPFANRFNAPSREAIVKRIFELRNIPYDFETFLTNDNTTREAITSSEKTKNRYISIGCSH